MSSAPVVARRTKTCDSHGELREPLGHKAARSNLRKSAQAECDGHKVYVMCTHTHTHIHMYTLSYLMYTRARTHTHTHTHTLSQALFSWF